MSILTLGSGKFCSTTNFYFNKENIRVQLFNFLEFYFLRIPVVYRVICLAVVVLKPGSLAG